MEGPGVQPGPSSNTVSNPHRELGKHSRPTRPAGILQLSGPACRSWLTVSDRRERCLGDVRGTDGETNVAWGPAVMAPSRTVDEGGLTEAVPVAKHVDRDAFSDPDHDAALLEAVVRAADPRCHEQTEADSHERQKDDDRVQAEARGLEHDATVDVLQRTILVFNGPERMDANGCDTLVRHRSEAGDT